MQDVETPNAAPPPDVLEIVGIVASETDVSPSAILGKRRFSSNVFARHVAMFIATDVFGHSLQSVGKAFGCHHSTVLHGRDAMRAKQREDRKTERFVALLAQMCAQKAGHRRMAVEATP